MILLGEITSADDDSWDPPSWGPLGSDLMATALSFQASGELTHVVQDGSTVGNRGTQARGKETR
jgi:hypothetical protein